jgi:hypothetical protein
MENATIRTKLYTKICEIIKADLTTGAKDNECVPLTTTEIAKFLQDNSQKIQDCINEMVADYKADNELEVLQDPCDDWITEYLYSHVSYRFLA